MAKSFLGVILFWFLGCFLQTISPSGSAYVKATNHPRAVKEPYRQTGIQPVRQHQGMKTARQPIKQPVRPTGMQSTGSRESFPFSSNQLLSPSDSELVHRSMRRWQNDTHFNDTLLIVQINFNCPIKVLLTHYYLWEPVMKHIVYYGPFNNDLISQLTARNITSFYRKDPASPEGTLQYRSAIDAMERFPSFSGYLFLQDDFHIDINSLRSWNLSSIWVSAGHGKIVIPDFNNPTSPKDWVWPHYSGLRAVLNVLNHSSQMYDDIVRCTGSNDTWIAGGYTSDFFYIPRAAVESFLHVCGYFSNHLLFVEVAIPTYMKCFHGNITVEEKRFCGIDKLADARLKCDSYPTMHHVKISGGQEHIHYVAEFMYGRNFSTILQH